MTSPQKPALATVAGVELGSVGFWDISTHLDWHPTADDMAAAIAALDCPAIRRPVLKFGHTGEPGEGDPTIGVIDNMRMSDDGQTLIGDFVGVPGWLAEADSEGRSVLASAYPDRSGEWSHDFQCQLGHTHPFVLHAMALLGVMRPGIGTLESLYDLYTKAPEKEEVAVAKAAVALAGTTADQVRSAYYNGPAATNYSLWIREMYVDPPELIVQDDMDDTLLRVAYSVSGDGEVEFDDGQAVKIQYVNARAQAEKPLVAFASRAEARVTPTTSPASAGVDTEKEGAMPTFKEDVAQKLGIAPDADDATALQALDEALAERAESDASTEQAPAESLSMEQVAARAKEGGFVLVEAAQYETTVAQASQGAQAREQQLREADERTVDFAISKGRVATARRGHHLQALASDREGHTAVLNQIPDGVVPLASSGHSIEPAEDVVPDDLSWFDTAPTEPSKREDA